MRVSCRRQPRRLLSGQPRETLEWPALVARWLQELNTFTFSNHALLSLPLAAGSHANRNLIMSNPAKQMLKTAVDKTLVPLVNYLTFRARASRQNVIEVILDNALADSAAYAESHMKEALLFRAREDLWDFVLPRIEFDGLVAEFGVFKAEAINYFARKLGPSKKLYGFDSFEGLPVDWKGHVLKKGHFSLGGQLPKVEPNVVLVKGWFDQTVPSFLDKHPGNFSFVHVDSSTYEAARLVLELIGGRLQPGTTIVFDEYYGFRGWRLGEWKAWTEFVEAAGIEYEYMGFAKEQVAVKIKSMGSLASPQS